MNRKLLIIILIIIILVVLVIVFSFQKKEEETIKIGFIAPFSGNSAVFGEVERTVIDIAVEEINNAGGVNGKKFKVIYEDGGCNQKDAINALYKLLLDPEIKIIMPLCSAETLAVAPITQERKILTFAAWVFHPDVSDAGSYIFRNSINDKVSAELLATAIRENYNRVGVIYEQTDYPVGLKNAFKQRFEDLGGEVVEESYLQDAKDMRTQITKLLAKNVEIVFINPNTPATGTIILKQLKEQGYQGEIYGNYIGSNPEIQKLTEAENMIFYSDPYIPDNEIKAHILEKYKEKTGGPPAFEYPALSRYDVVYVLKEAIENVGEDPTAIRDYLLSHSFTGALGDFHYDNNGDVIGINPSLYQIKNGEAILYEK